MDSMLDGWMEYSNNTYRGKYLTSNTPTTEESLIAVVVFGQACRIVCAIFVFIFISTFGSVRGLSQEQSGQRTELSRVCVCARDQIASTASRLEAGFRRHGGGETRSGVAFDSTWQVGQQLKLRVVWAMQFFLSYLLVFFIFPPLVIQPGLRCGSFILGDCG